MPLPRRVYNRNRLPMQSTIEKRKEKMIPVPQCCITENGIDMAKLHSMYPYMTGLYAKFEEDVVDTTSPPVLTPVVTSVPR